MSKKIEIKIKKSWGIERNFNLKNLTKKEKENFSKLEKSLKNMDNYIG